jgi:hypothetical protein
MVAILSRSYVGHQSSTFGQEERFAFIFTPPCRSTAGESRNGFCPGDRRLLLAAQFRLLAVRLDHELPIDIRSIKNTFCLCFQLLWEQSA